MPVRCGWCSDNEADIAYHDLEWGVPVHEDRVLFEFLILEGAQAGLSWQTILNKRAGYATAFASFDPVEVARFSDARLASLREDSSIVRNRAKIASARDNARAFLDVQTQFGSFDRYVWGFVDDQPVINHFSSWKQIPAQTPVSQRLSKELKKRGFRFVGPTICYAYMQAVGMVMDHSTDCFRYAELTR